MQHRQSQRPAAHPPIEQPLLDRIFAAFGTPKRLADLTGITFSTVYDWRNHGRIPSWRVAQIAAAADRHGVALPEEVAARKKAA